MVKAEGKNLEVFLMLLIYLYKKKIDMAIWHTPFDAEILFLGILTIY